MKTKIITGIALCLFIMQLQAQANLETILAEIAQNNKTLQTQNKYWEAQKLFYKTGNTLYNPTISYDYMYGTPNNIAGNQTDINVVQQFDFPTVYSKKRKLAEEKSKQADLSLDANRQDILLEAKKICIELVYRNKLQEKIEERKIMTEKYLSDFQRKLDEGEGNILDVNKAKLLLIQINQENQSNISAINQLNQRLTGLNGGLELIFDDSEYPALISIPPFEELIDSFESYDPSKKILAQQSVIAQQDIKVSHALKLPKFEAGFHYQGILGQNFYGGKIGMSVPLWENKYSVAQKKAEFALVEMQSNSYQNQYYYLLKQNYEAYENLQKTLNEYQSVLSSLNNIQLLDKALFFGEITTIQYFMEVGYFYQAENNFLLIEKELYEAIAELYKFQL